MHPLFESINKNEIMKNSIRLYFLKFGVLLIFALFFFACDSTYDSFDESYDSGAYIAGDKTGDASGGEITDGSQQGDSTIVSGQITAGEWNDLENWDFWSNLFQDSEISGYPDFWKFDVTTRIAVLLKDNSGNFVGNMKVELKDADDNLVWTTVTDKFGQAELWPSLKDIHSAENLVVEIDGTQYSNLKVYSEGTNEISLNYSTRNTVANSIDIAFVVDATGSMSDELEYLKVELVDVIDSVKESNSMASINLGSVFYRDEGDAYVTRKSEFDSDISKTISFIQNQRAEGGGDFPEAVHSALDVAINNLQWRTNVNSKILFLLLDAPPHEEDAVVAKVNEMVKKAAEKGIKIIPITASGIDKKTEFLMRYFSITTNGTYVFITNHSGIGGDHIEPTIGEYEVEYLNDLLVRLINKYL